MFTSPHNYNRSLSALIFSILFKFQALMEVPQTINKYIFSKKKRKYFDISLTLHIKLSVTFQNSNVKFLIFAKLTRSLQQDRRPIFCAYLSLF